MQTRVQREKKDCTSGLRLGARDFLMRPLRLIYISCSRFLTFAIRRRHWRATTEKKKKTRSSISPNGLTMRYSAVTKNKKERKPWNYWIEKEAFQMFYQATPRHQPRRPPQTVWECGVSLLSFFSPLLSVCEEEEEDVIKKKKPSGKCRKSGNFLKRSGMFAGHIEPFFYPKGFSFLVVNARLVLHSWRW